MKPLRTGCTRAAVIGLSDALLRILRLRRRFCRPTCGFNCPGSGNSFGTSTTSTGAGGSPVSTAGVMSS